MEAAKRRFVMGNPEDDLGKSKQTDNVGRGVTIEATTPLWLPTGGGGEKNDVALHQCGGVIRNAGSSIKSYIQAKRDSSNRRVRNSFVMNNELIHRLAPLRTAAFGRVFRLAMRNVSFSGGRRTWHASMKRLALPRVPLATIALAVTTKPPLRLLAFILPLKPLFLVATIQERIQDCGGTWSGGLTSQP
ncbi:hypothetical protein NDA11_000238 [Ustilago hordei]|uniref:Uncharacterized protein n=1 Tax=Ustilago hordei TaxID=120017 RepID=I2FX39_USTHO|nr:uncharacterized protein UHO2_04305 [Ustilago hordei]KAJ1037040.1 hypothetical protein NDA10_007535 [Ustilago hordei]KAJ1573661.1 hypothetical protein NDA15_001122 [Ustilago hordei]KAJ1579207.1 hypothetical protein NDA11_000238 [Ustilago hordei]KAJ1579520.1 hypothetical protein NDA12_000515 [Ustilago hordei]KAJ1598577.1 hypothetical protein NDA14_004047 [Ustilago hordei]